MCPPGRTPEHFLQRDRDVKANHFRPNAAIEIIPSPRSTSVLGSGVDATGPSTVPVNVSVDVWIDQSINPLAVPVGGSISKKLYGAPWSSGKVSVIGQDVHDGGKPITNVAVLFVKVTKFPNAKLTSELADALVTPDIPVKLITLPGTNVALPVTAKSYQNTPLPGEFGSRTIEAEVHQAGDANPSNTITLPRATVKNVPFVMTPPYAQKLALPLNLARRFRRRNRRMQLGLRP